jgi:hypothetical protein
MAGSSSLQEMLPAPTSGVAGSDVDRLLLAQALQPKVAHGPLDALGGIAQTIGAALAYKHGEDDKRKQLADAVTAASSYHPWVNPDTNALQPGQPTQRDMLVRALSNSSNPDLQDTAVQLRLKDMQPKTREQMEAEWLQAHPDQQTNVFLGRKPPEPVVTDIYDPVTHRKQKAIVRPDTGATTPIGGVEAPDIKAPEGMVPNDPNDPTKGFHWADGYLAGKEAIGAASHPVTTINMKQEGKEGETVGEYYGKTYGNIQTAGLQAPGKIARMDALTGFLNQVHTGQFAPQKLAITKVVKGLGFDPQALGIDDTAGPAEAAQAIVRQMALELRNPSGGAGMPGALSDSDREYLSSMLPRLQSDPNAWPKIVDIYKRMAQRDIDVAQLTRDYRKQHGHADEGMFDALQQFSTAHPLFEPMQASDAAAPAAPASNPPAAASQPGPAAHLSNDQLLQGLGLK